MSCICQGTAIFTLIVGAFRTWRLQNAMVRSKAITGGFEIVFLAAGIFLVSNVPLKSAIVVALYLLSLKILLVLFILVVAVNINKQHIVSHMIIHSHL